MQTVIGSPRSSSLDGIIQIATCWTTVSLLQLSYSHLLRFLLYRNIRYISYRIDRHYAMIGQNLEGQNFQDDAIWKVFDVLIYFYLLMRVCVFLFLLFAILLFIIKHTYINHLPPPDLPFPLISPSCGPLPSSPFLSYSPLCPPPPLPSPSVPILSLLNLLALHLTHPAPGLI